MFLSVWCVSEFLCVVCVCGVWFVSEILCVWCACVVCVLLVSVSGVWCTCVRVRAVYVCAREGRRQRARE